MSDDTGQSERPTTDDPEAWKDYWARVQPREWFERWGYWRTEPEIDADRQQFLAERRAIQVDIKRGIFPFGDETDRIKLTRADVEWLLATHESRGVKGPLPWELIKDKREEARHRGLDLRGADLRGVDLHELPLTGLTGALEVLDHARTMKHPTVRTAAAVRLEGARLDGAHLQGATLRDTHLEGAMLNWAHMEQAKLRGAHLEGASMPGTHLEGARLDEAHLERAGLVGSHLEGASLAGAHLEGASLERAHLEAADLYAAHLGGKHLPAQDWDRVRQWQDNIPRDLPPAILSGARLDAATRLRDTVLCDGEHGFVSVADVQWAGVNLGVLSWKPERLRRRGSVAFPVLSDERAARARNDPFTGKVKPVSRRADEIQAAVRAYRQLAGALREQGLNDEADLFAHRGQVLQRRRLRQQRAWGRWLFSWLLAALAGYGYRLERILIAYALVLLGFTVAYPLVGPSVFHHATWYQPWVEGLLVSFTAIHGRVFFEQFGLDNALSWVAAVESVLGLVIEAVFTSMLVQRFFAR